MSLLGDFHLGLLRPLSTRINNFGIREEPASVSHANSCSLQSRSAIF